MYSLLAVEDDDTNTPGHTELMRILNEGERRDREEREIYGESSTREQRGKPSN